MSQWPVLVSARLENNHIRTQNSAHYVQEKDGYVMAACNHKARLQHERIRFQFSFMYPRNMFMLLQFSARHVQAAHVHVLGAQKH